MFNKKGVDILGCRCKEVVLRLCGDSDKKYYVILNEDKRYHLEGNHIYHFTGDLNTIHIIKDGLEYQLLKIEKGNE